MDHMPRSINNLALNRPDLAQPPLEFRTRVFIIALPPLAVMFTLHQQNGRLDLLPRGDDLIASVDKGVDTFMHSIRRNVPATILSKLCPMTREPAPIFLLEQRASAFQVINDLLLARKRA